MSALVRGLGCAHLLGTLAVAPVRNVTMILIIMFTAGFGLSQFVFCDLNARAMTIDESKTPTTKTRDELS